MNVVTMERLTKRFGEDTAVDGITLAVAPGTIVGIIGPSGAGKTTLVRLMTGALAPTEGEVRVMGEDPLRFRRETRERIGYMPQSFALYPGSHDPRERRLRRVAVRPPMVAPTASDARGPAMGRPVGRPEPPRRPPVGRHAATARAGVGARPRP